MEIRPTQPEDLPALVEIYDKARQFMRRSGNAKQWSDDYPSAETATEDLRQGGSYVCLDNGHIVATFFFSTEPEPTYRKIQDGHWLDDARYGVIHRVASDGSVKGVMRQVLDFCFTQTDNIRIDTHRDNQVMRDNLTRYGFRYCGIIHLLDGSERLAFQYKRKSESAVPPHFPL